MLKKLIKTNKKNILTLIFILLFLTTIMGVGFNKWMSPSRELELTPILSSVFPLGDGTLEMFNESIEDGDNLLEDIYYNFTADLIDTANYSNVYDAGYLETEFKDGSWASPDMDNITIGDLVNYNDYILGFSDFYDIVGSPPIVSLVKLNVPG